jgi:hypothetical protein
MACVPIPFMHTIVNSRRPAVIVREYLIRVIPQADRDRVSGRWFLIGELGPAAGDQHLTAHGR